jgi:hypothetical protein
LEIGLHSYETFHYQQAFDEEVGDAQSASIRPFKCSIHCGR